MRKQTKSRQRHQQQKSRKKVLRKVVRLLPPGTLDAVSEALERSRQRAHDPSPSLALPADKRALLDHVDPLSGVRNGLRAIAAEREEWAGYPMPMQGARLVVEPTYPLAENIRGFDDSVNPRPEPEERDRTSTVRNHFWSDRLRCDVVIWQEASGKIDWGKLFVGEQPTDKMLHTLYAADAWGIEQEGAAVHTLGTLLRHRPFKQYLLTGMFMEPSRRSGIHYLFRRLRPTLAISHRTHKGHTGMRVIAALCLHPIAYYEGSWAGAMCPTDDVIAHLMLMRGDEHMFWRRANQHHVGNPNAGVF
jgi:hypothetical protein